MSARVVLICDRCGAEFKDWQDNGGWLAEERDLCEGCTSSFVKWLAGETTRREQCALPCVSD